MVAYNYATLARGVALSVAPVRPSVRLYVGPSVHIPCVQISRSRRALETFNSAGQEKLKKQIRVIKVKGQRSRSLGTNMSKTENRFCFSYLRQSEYD